MTDEITKIDIDQICCDRRNQDRQNRGRLRYEQNYWTGNFRGNARSYQDFRRKIIEKNTEVIIGMKVIAEKEVGVGVGKDHFQGIMIIIEGQ